MCAFRQFTFKYIYGYICYILQIHTNISLVRLVGLSPVTGRLLRRFSCALKRKDKIIWIVVSSLAMTV